MSPTSGGCRCGVRSLGPFRPVLTAEGHDRGAEPLPERAAVDRLCEARGGAGRHHRAAVAGSAGRLFRRAQGPVPGARISQDRPLSRLPRKRSESGPKSRMPMQGSCSSSAATSSARPKNAQVSQIAVPEHGRGDGGTQRLASGTSFDDLAKERGLKPADVDLDWSRSRRSSIPRSRMRPSRCRRARSASRWRASLVWRCSRSARSSRVSKLSYESVAANLKKEIATERARKSGCRSARQDGGRARRRRERRRGRTRNWD